MRSITRSLAQAVPTARVREIDGAAHAVPFDAPDNFARVIAAAETAARKHKARPQAGSGIFRFTVGQRAW
jgi:hypothetical protein